MEKIEKERFGCKMKPSGIGGMAVMEGVMMKNREKYAVAVRQPNNEIAVEISTHKDFSDKVKLFKLPIFRGMLAFVDSMVIGVKVLNYSASFFEDEDETQNKNGKKKSEKKAKKNAESKKDFDIEEVSATHIDKDNSDNAEKKADKKDKDSTFLMVLAVLLSIVLSIALFMVLPVLLTDLLRKVVSSRFVMNLIEGFVRLAIFIGYVVLAAKMPEIKRVFRYHGAEHKTINCLENGFELTVENVRWQSKQHKRCGTSFMLLVVLISLVFFLFIPTGNLAWRVSSRILLVPFIAGVSYEFIRLAGKSENRIVNAVSKPGLWMQGLTTSEPDDTMIEVAIASVEAVFDWRAFLEITDEAKADKTTDISEHSKKSAQVKSAKKSNAEKTEETLKEDNADKPKNTLKENNTDKPENTLKKESISKRESAAKREGTAKKDSTGKKENASKKNTAKKETASTLEKTSEEERAFVKNSATNQADTVKSENHTKNNTQNRRNINPVQKKPARDEEEDDEILRALDRFFDENPQAAKKAADGK